MVHLTSSPSSLSSITSSSRLRRFVLSITLIWLSLLPYAVHGDADFEQVRTRLKKDHSGRLGDPKEKYFHESTFHPHYDGRFAARTLGYDERQPELAALIQSYLFTMADLGAETWIMHGTLMGWWWNRAVLPWDSDIDMQTTLETLAFLHSFYNLATFHYHPAALAGSPLRSYMLEINPTFAAETAFDGLNMIDARWISVDTGAFIDITAVRPNMTARALGVAGALRCKDEHHYLEDDLFPLRASWFEGVPVRVPFEYAWLLEEEYGRESLTRTEIELHRWNAETQRWEPKGEEAKDKPINEENMLTPDRPIAGLAGGGGRA